MIQVQILNGLSGDPAVLCKVPNVKPSFLFDIGNLNRIATKELIKITHVFVSHTHVDHFIGFDRWLRSHIPHRKRLYVTGPPGMIEQVGGRLRSYTWNLLGPGELVFEVIEQHANGVKRAVLKNDDGFIPDLMSENLAGTDLLLFDEGSFKGVILDHGTPCVAYRYDSPRKCAINPERLKKSGLEPGPWLSVLTQAYLQNQLDGFLTVHGSEYSISSLAEDLCELKEPSSVGYVTDIVCSAENLELCSEFFHGVGLLICEASFRDADEVKAFTKKHLTTRHAALLASCAQAKSLKVFHFSNIYGPSHRDSLREAEGFFKEYSSMSSTELAQEVDRVNRKIPTSESKG